MPAVSPSVVNRPIRGDPRLCISTVPAESAHLAWRPPCHHITVEVWFRCFNFSLSSCWSCRPWLRHNCFNYITMYCSPRSGALLALSSKEAAAVLIRSNQLVERRWCLRYRLRCRICMFLSYCSQDPTNAVLAARLHGRPLMSNATWQESASHVAFCLV